MKTPNSVSSEPGAGQSVVLLEEVGEGLVRQLLKCFHLIPREQV
jgi:hypothetical protein